MRTRHTAEALRLRRELDAELAANGKAAGRDLVWSAADRQILDLIISAIDRRVDLLKRYAALDDTKLRVKLSAELRLAEANIERLLRRVKTDVPQPMSKTSLKAQRAANARWDRERTGGN